VTLQEQLKNKVAIVWTAPEREEEEEGNRSGTTPLETILMCICIEHIRLAQMSYMNISLSLSFFSWEMSHHSDVSNTNRVSF
jgi:hypothetical protein